MTPVIVRKWNIALYEDFGNRSESRQFVGNHHIWRRNHHIRRRNHHTRWQDTISKLHFIFPLYIYIYNYFISFNLFCYFIFLVFCLQPSCYHRLPHVISSPAFELFLHHLKSCSSALTRALPHLCTQIPSALEVAIAASPATFLAFIRTAPPAHSSTAGVPPRSPPFSSSPFLQLPCMVHSAMPSVLAPLILWLLCNQSISPLPPPFSPLLSKPLFLPVTVTLSPNTTLFLFYSHRHKHLLSSIPANTTTIN